MRNYSILKLSLFPVFILFFLAGVTRTVAFAQSSNQTIVVKKSASEDDGEVKIKKTVEVEDVNGEMKVTVTTIENGNENIEIYKGVAAEKYLAQQQEIMVVKMEEMNIDDMEFTFDVEGMEEGDGKKIIIMTADSDGGSTSSSQSVWVTEGDLEDDLNMKDMNVNVTKGEEGEPTKIELSYTNEKGEKVDKIMIIDEAQKAESMAQVQELLEDMNIHIDMDVSEAEVDGKTVKTVIITKKIVIEESDASGKEAAESKMFESFSVSPNPSKGVVKIAFTPMNKGKVNVTVLDVKGNVLFTDSYNGKGAYAKTVSIPDYNGVVMVKVAQGNVVEVRKLIIE